MTRCAEIIVFYMIKIIVEAVLNIMINFHEGEVMSLRTVGACQSLKSGYAIDVKSEARGGRTE